MGHFWSAIIRESLFPPATQFHASDIPDMSGKVVLVTGANAGIGKETARVLLTKNAKVYIACRDKAKGEAAIRELKDSTGKDAFFLQLNLANLKSVKAAGEEFLSKEPLLHVLFNNAGVMTPPVEMITDDGYDLQFGTNVVGHFYFTKLVMPALLAAAATSSDGTARVVNTSSNGHWFDGLDYNTFRDSPARRKKSSSGLYAQSKTGNIVFSAELARRYGGQGIVSTALNPGGIKTELARHQSSLNQMFLNMLLHDVSYGALTQLYAGTTAEGAKLNGKYLIPWARIGDPRADTQDPQQGKELWNWLEEQVKDI
ncbi:NAD(P)-binding protein [Rhizopogon vinicolor AM-OR11-026]|uniref:NAD(P)-binding protein n=1 Tax=Rhizopogon vinicolor AM-OR11-026 TaxID=1314800 RepID=A0A1B7MLK9_9AGAM|nr:NAD(P)-binding protein [Rhizopogon vinicolor AM-OR11-026]